MLIANPIYDVVFKRLMENEKVAKFFIGTLMNETIEAVQVKPQEFTYTGELAGLAVFRLDFIATVRTQSGEYKKVLIEIQKARNMIDLMRFRNYLSEQYKKADKVNGREEALPIVTIYILGFRLAEVESACVKVARRYIDLITGAELSAKSDFIEKLTHDSYIVQVDRITDRYQTRLDKLLSVFEQRHFVDESEITKEYLYRPDLEEVKEMTEILHYVGTDPQERKQIEIEREAWRTVNAMFEEKERRYQEQLAQKQRELEEKEKEIEQQRQIIAELKRKLNEAES